MSNRAIPMPVLLRLLMLFGGGIGCLIIGIVALLATGDRILLAMSAILGVSFITKGFLLKRKLNTGKIYSVSGVCVSIAPKILGRYRRMEFINTDTGDDTYVILPKKIIFKVGHVYTCYFDNQISNRPTSNDTSKGVFISMNMDLPTNGFLGFEDFGIYQEKSVKVAAVTESADNPPPSGD